MKLQYLAVIFVVIIIPISLVLSEYIQTQIDTIVLQSSYKKNLDDATYAALKAFQINSINNKYSSISDSKIRDVQASINTFYNSLGTAMDSYVSSKEELSSFIPAVLFTLYDGYYIYSSYDNRVDENGNVREGNPIYQNGLKPYIYYSAEYNLSTTKSVIVNYTLDNRITIYGDLEYDFNENHHIDDTERFQTISGYLINPSTITINEVEKKVTYNGVEIGPETLTEYLITVDDDAGTTSKGDYPYIIYNNQKVYKDTEDTTIKTSITNLAGETKEYNISVPKLFRYSDSKKTYLQSDLRKVYEEYFEIDFESITMGDINITDESKGEAEFKNSTIYYNKIDKFQSTSAFNFYKEALQFSKVVEACLGGIKREDIKGYDGTLDGTGIEDDLIFDFDGDKNDPMKENSIFNDHRVSVIRKSIETNLSAAISNYTERDELSTTEFQLPVIDEENWYNIANNVSIISFMQGIPIGMKYFNNYSVISNTKNEEVINSQNIYIVTKDSSGNREYHQPGCGVLVENVNNGTLTIDNAYTLLSFQRQTVDISEYSKEYFYPQSRGVNATTGCYNCIVNATPNYNIDEIIEGQIYDPLDGTPISGMNISSNNGLKKVREIYLRALARERYDLYNSNYDL